MIVIVIVTVIVIILMLIIIVIHLLSVIIIVVSASAAIGGSETDPVAAGKQPCAAHSFCFFIGLALFMFVCFNCYVTKFVVVVVVVMLFHC